MKKSFFTLLTLSLLQTTLFATIGEDKRQKELNLTKKELEFINNHTIRVSISKYWRPFTFTNYQKTPLGISSEYWGLIKNRLNLKVEYTIHDKFTEQLAAIKEKSEDIIFSTGATKDREEYAIFTKPYISFPISIVTQKDENFIESIEYLFDKKVVVGRDFTAHKMLKSKYPNMSFILVDSIKEGLELINEKKAFAYVDIKPNLLYNINKLGLESIKISGNTDLEFKLAMMIRDDYKPLQTAINKAISTITDEELRAIISRWENVQFEKSFDYAKMWQVISLVLIIFLALIYRYTILKKANRNLKRVVDRRTKELKVLNKNLEKLVDKKTKELQEINTILDEAQKIAHLGSYHYLVEQDQLSWSSELYNIFNIFKREKITMEVFYSYVHKGDIDRVKKSFDSLEDGIRSSFDYRVVLKDGSIKYIQATAKKSFNSELLQTSIVGTVLDITELKVLEHQKREQENLLAQQSKMAALGEMLENIAHQWRQPLSVISTSATTIQLYSDMGSLDKRFLDETMLTINNSSQYLSKTIDDFRNFFSSKKEKSSFFIKEAIDRSLMIVSSKIERKSISVIKNIDNSQLYTLENELIQVLINILNNAIDILESCSKKFIFIQVDRSEEFLFIRIKDSGGGVPKKILNRVFEPYFTTKHKSQGTGIGLYMSSQIVTKNLDGTLSVRNREYNIEGVEYKGAEFIISLPL